MALDFPGSPSPGQTFQRWQWDSKHWSVPTAPTSGTGIPGPAGPAGATGLNAADQISGILIPYYLPPNDPYSDTNTQRLLDVMKKYHDVPVMVILNPANGPGATADPNYANFIKLLHGAGGVVLGYVPTGFGVTSATTVKTDIDKWRTLYSAQPPDGIFLDEMPWDTGPGNVGTAYIDKYKDYTDYCHINGFTPTVGNPGTNQQPAWFSTYTADVIVVHEDVTYPSEASMEGNYVGGHADYPYTRRGALVYNQPTLDNAALDTLRKNVQWVYVTNDNLTAGVLNPWDTLPTYLESLFAVLSTSAADITSVTVGTGLSGGGTAGDLTIAMTVPVLVANGGTGAGTAPAALANLGGLPLTGGTIAGALTVVNDVTVGGVVVLQGTPTGVQHAINKGNTISVICRKLGVDCTVLNTDILFDINLPAGTRFVITSCVVRNGNPGATPGISSGQVRFYTLPAGGGTNYMTVGTGGLTTADAITQVTPTNNISWTQNPLIGRITTAVTQSPGLVNFFIFGYPLVET